MTKGEGIARKNKVSDNPWFIGILGGVISTILVSVLSPLLKNSSFIVSSFYSKVVVYTFIDIVAKGYSTYNYLVVLVIYIWALSRITDGIVEKFRRSTGSKIWATVSILGVFLVYLMYTSINNASSNSYQRFKEKIICSRSSYSERIDLEKKAIEVKTIEDINALIKSISCE